VAPSVEASDNDQDAEELTMHECCGQGTSQGCRCYTEAEAAAEAVRAFVRRRVPHPQDAEDITQDALLRVYRSVEDLRHVDAFEGWMYQVTRSAITDHYRKAPRQPVPMDPEDLNKISDGDQDAPTVQTQLAGCLRSLLQRVPEDYRRALELTDLGGLTQREAADRLGLSNSGMKSRVQRGRRLLRAEIRRCCELTLATNGSLADAQVREHGPSCERTATSRSAIVDTHQLATTISPRR
jgi:RNA polymerase sigma-70 factor (ECF subfamily)